MPDVELLANVGQSKPPEEKSHSLILLRVAGQHNALEDLLREHGYTVVVPGTADQAVAVCLHNPIAAALIDQSSLAEAEDWSLAKSLKMVTAKLPVLLLVDGPTPEEKDVPVGVDCLISDGDPQAAVDMINRYVSASGQTRHAS